MGLLRLQTKIWAYILLKIYFHFTLRALVKLKPHDGLLLALCTNGEQRVLQHAELQSQISLKFSKHCVPVRCCALLKAVLYLTASELRPSENLAMTVCPACFEIQSCGMWDGEKTPCLGFTVIF